MKLRSLAIALLAGGAVATVPAIALAADTTLQIGPTAQIQARGAYVLGTVTITCPAGDTIGISYPAMLMLEQAVTKTALATGYGFVSAQSCSGGPQTFTVPIIASLPGSPFRIGPAEATAFGAACDANFNCVPFNSGPVTIRIVH